MKLNNLFYDLLIDLQLPEFYAEILNLILVSVLIFISVFIILDFIMIHITWQFEMTNTVYHIGYDCL